MKATTLPERKLLPATIVAVVVAGLLLIIFVLPAEYGIDPLGTGKAFGLLGLSSEAPAAIVDQTETLRSELVRFELAPFESVEYKYRLETGASLSFSWQASGEVLYDFHAEPDGAEVGYAESFDNSRAEARKGNYLAPFSGIHGWFWENRGTRAVTVELVTAGFYSAATEFRDGDASPHALGDIRTYLIAPLE